ncbi:MAG TPA: GTP cyclohydrolase I, partial [Gemmatimonadaceae bacterium]|nr:GTP cyclohydrolase I [Gemmatimonadaceae bacterium]
MNGSAASIDSVRAATAYDASGNGAHGNGAHGNGAHGNGASHHGAADGAASNGSATVDGVPDVDGLGPAGRALAGHVHEMLALLGEAPSRPGLRKTPLRVANALAWLTRGYGQSVAAVVGDAVFPERHE